MWPSVFPQVLNLTFGQRVGYGQRAQAMDGRARGRAANGARVSKWAVECKGKQNEWLSKGCKSTVH